MRSFARSLSRVVFFAALLLPIAPAVAAEMAGVSDARPEGDGAQRPDPFARGPFPSPSAPGTLAPRLDEADEIATLEAIRFALTEVADGSSYVWYRAHGRLNGLVNPTSSFKDARGRVCRHIVLIMSAGTQTGRVEGIACREADGRWLLEG